MSYTCSAYGKPLLIETTTPNMRVLDSWENLRRHKLETKLITPIRSAAWISLCNSYTEHHTKLLGSRLCLFQSTNNVMAENFGR